MKYNVQNGYRIIGVDHKQSNESSELSRALDFLTSMEICQTCIPTAKSELKLGNYKFDINYNERIIYVS